MNRPRYRLPRTLIFFGALLIAAPALNYISLARQLGIRWDFPRLVFQSLDYFTLLLLLLPPVIGIGLLLVRKWAWYFFLFYALMLIGYNISTSIQDPRTFNFGTTLTTVAFVAAMIYFVRPDVSAPYMKMYPRGFRLQRRKPIEVAIEIDGKALQTRDVSETGLYADWDDFPYDPGARATVVLGGLERTATVVRVDTNGAGLAFDARLNREELKALAGA